MKSYCHLGSLIAAAALVSAFSGCEQATSSSASLTAGSSPAKVEKLVQLPDDVNTADGMCLMPDGSVLICVPNVNDESQPPSILRLTADNKLEKFFDPPRHPDTGKAYPFGICVDPASGDVYYGDLQWFAEKKPNWKSRVVHIHLKDGKPVETSVLASGMVVSNAVAIRDGYLYTSDTSMLHDTKPLVTGVYRFKLGEEGVELKQPLDQDPHCIATILTHNEKVGFGADGLTFDDEGNLYVGNFADGTIHKIEFDAQGNPATPRPAPIWAKSPLMKSCDGILYDAPRKRILVADSLANAVQAVSLDGKVTCLACEASDDGADGKLDQPCEVVIRGNELIISNFDLPIEGGVNQKFETPNCQSVIKMD